MGEYQIKSGFITDQTDFQLAIAGIAYEIEKAHIHNVDNKRVIKQLMSVEIWQCILYALK